MNTKLHRAALAAAAASIVSFAAPAMAQEAAAEPYVGVSAGYHDAGVDAAAGGNVKDSGAIFGGFAGVDVPISGNLFVGAEANYHFGTGAIDHEYGVNARLGVKTGFGKVYVRGGYQEVNFDLGHILSPLPIPAGVDDSDGDYLVGIGTDINLGTDSNVALRLGVDTIAFDSTRATVGVALKF
jgi:outer membrane immunogenic protein